MSTALALVDTPRAPSTLTPGGVSIFDDPMGFKIAMRAAEMFAGSTIVPKEYQGNEGNCLLAISVARRMGADPLMVMQNLYIIHGRPSWSSQWVIAMLNTSGRFEPLDWRITGQGDARECVAFARRVRDGKLVEGTPVSLKMAKEERWGTKWLTLPEQMLRYRAATFFARLHAPEVLLGMPTADETEDIQGAEIAQKWTPAGAPVAVQSGEATVALPAGIAATGAAEHDPQRAEFEQLLGAYPWSEKQRGSLATRWADSDMAGREKLLAGMRKQVHGDAPAAEVRGTTVVREGVTEPQRALAEKLLKSRVWTAEERDGWLRVLDEATKEEATGHLDAIKAELERRKAARKAASDEDTPLTLDSAMAMTLPGTRTDFEGEGGKPLSKVAPSTLRKVAAWIDADEERKAQYERLRGALHLVLEQWAKETATEEQAQPPVPQDDDDPFGF